MNRFAHLLKVNSLNKIIAYSIALVAFFGFLDASYLTVKHYKNEVPPCSLVNGCELVTTSAYAKVFGIPVALIGMFGYATLIIISCMYADNQKPTTLNYLFIVSLCAFLASIYFTMLQIFVIHALCQYCIASALSSTTCFGLTLWLKRLYTNACKI